MIWTARNKWLHEKQHATAKETVQLIKKYLGGLLRIVDLKERRILQSVGWKPLRSFFVKINFDASFDKQENRSYFGIIIRNNLGNVLFTKTVRHDSIPSSFAADAMACFQAILLGIQVGLQHVEIEWDCLTVIRNLIKSRGERSVIGAYLHNICVSCNNFQSCIFQHVKKFMNGVAHKLATKGIRRREGSYLVGTVPAYALDAFEAIAVICL